MANDIIDIVVTDNSDNVQINATPNLITINVSNTSGNIIGSNFYLASTFGALPAIGDATILYVVSATSLMYRWNGSAYVQINSIGSMGWGTITGILSNQTDLQTALNAKQDDITLTTTGTSGAATFISNTLNIPNYAPNLSGYVPYTGATTNVDLGEYSIKSGAFKFDLTPSGTLAEGTMQWNSSDGTVDIGLKGGNVVLQVGQETVYEVRNDTGSTILSGTALYENGVTAGSGRITAGAYVADGSIREVRFLGLATEDISNGVNGFVTHFGYVRGLDTRGTSSSSISVGNETWAVGDILYVHPTVAGKLTNVKPQHEITVAIIITRHQSSGVLFVRPSSAGHLEDIHDVGISSVANNQGLFYDSASGLWKNKTIATVLGYTPQAALTNPITGTGTTNTIPKFTGTSALGNSNITDSGTIISLGSNTNISSGGLGIGTSSLTQYSLRISKNITGSSTSYGIANDAIIQSDVTSSANYFNTFAQTQAATFTLTDLRHFFANQIGFGAGSTVTNQIGFGVSGNMTGGINNYGFSGNIAAGTNRYNLYMSGTAQNYLAGATVIGAGLTAGGVGTILTVTLTNGGSGYVDGTYTNVAGTAISATGTSSIYTVVILGGIVTSATLTWGGVNFSVGDTITISNTLLGGSGSGLIITVATAESGTLRIQGATNNARLMIQNTTTSINANDEIGAIRFSHRDGSAGASGTQAYIQAITLSTVGGADLVFGLKSSTAFTSATEDMRLRGNTGALLIGSSSQISTLTKLEVTGGTLLGGNLGIGTSYSALSSIFLNANITGGTVSYGIQQSGTIQSDVTSFGYYNRTIAQTAAASFNLGTLIHYSATQGTFGAGSTVATQIGFDVGSTLSGATTNYGFRGQITDGTNRWNLYMSGTADNHMAGSLGIGTTSLSGYSLRVSKQITGSSFSYGVMSDGVVQSDVTTAYGYRTGIGTVNSAFTLGDLVHYGTNQSTIGASSTVTNQIGFFVSGTLTGATNNYGFRGAMNAGTNRWNIYMDGTADNHLAGCLAIGVTTPVASAKLQVDSTTQGALFPRMTSTQKNAISSPATGLVVFDTTLGKLCVFSITWQTITSL